MKIWIILLRKRTSFICRILKSLNTEELQTQVMPTSIVRRMLIKLRKLMSLSEMLHLCFHPLRISINQVLLKNQKLVTK